MFRAHRRRLRRRSRGKSGEAAKAHHDIYDKAFSLVVGTAGKAFNLDDERADTARRYGNNNFGRGCLLARKLVEAGAVLRRSRSRRLGQAPAASSTTLHTTQGRPADARQGMGALVEDLVQRGMWQNTVVVWMGEFGRTPRINQNAGRDHWARCWSVVVGGGAIKGGLVYGSTDKDGTAVKDNPVKIGDLFATIYKGLGIDPNAAGPRQPRPAARHRRREREANCAILLGSRRRHPHRCPRGTFGCPEVFFSRWISTVAETPRSINRVDVCRCGNFALALTLRVAAQVSMAKPVSPPIERQRDRFGEADLAALDRRRINDDRGHRNLTFLTMSNKSATFALIALAALPHTAFGQCRHSLNSARHPAD